jgi:hypothetical protein
MREITSHKVNPVNDVIKVLVTDEPGAGGANHRYDVTGYDATDNKSFAFGARSTSSGVTILFQNGPIGDAGVNGITQEVLLAIIIDRLESFQKGQFACRENAIALTHLETAKLWLFKRTLDRMARGVEGTHAK